MQSVQEPLLASPNYIEEILNNIPTTQSFGSHAS